MKCQHPNCNNEAIVNANGKQLQHCSTKCRGQSNSLLSRKKAKETCLGKYGVENPRQVKEIKDRADRTVEERYGVKNISQSSVVKQQKKDTCFKNFGVEFPLQNDEIKSKIKATNLERYGVENPFQSKLVKDKMKVAYLKKFGVEYPGQVPEIKIKIMASVQESYGVDNPSKSAKVQAKILASGVNRKEYKFPSGKVIMIQGYENRAIDELLKQYHETEIVAGDPEKIPVIEYVDTDGKNRTYFPDIFIPKDNLIVEVKSTYTYSKDEKRNIKKKEACEKLGYKFQFYIG